MVAVCFENQPRSMASIAIDEYCKLFVGSFCRLFSLNMDDVFVVKLKRKSAFAYYVLMV